MESKLPICGKCGDIFPNHCKIKGKNRNLQRRKFCIKCSPFGNHNTKSSIVKTTNTHKQCSMCNAMKNKSEFYKKGGWCKHCLHEYQMMRWNLKRKQAIEYLGGKCKKCGIGNIHPSLFDFHHLNKKKYDWNKLRLQSESIMYRELDKCELLCVFCHRLHHLNHSLWKKTYEKIGEPYGFTDQFTAYFP